MKAWIQKKETERLDLLRLVASQLNLPDYMIEKDWWVTAALEALFANKLAGKFSFKGGTSLSKSWKILNRFSEDIDLVIDKTIFGVADEDQLGSSKRTKLRKEARNYIIESVKPVLQEQLMQLGIAKNQFNLYEEPSEDSDTDPTVLFLEYNALTEIPNDYTKPIVKIEIGVRAMMEPTESRILSSMLAEILNPGETIAISSVLPERTFWEKAFLLHELFQKPANEMKLSRMSRHWYDLYCLWNTGFGKKAIADKELFMVIRNHRKIFSKVQGVNYDEILPEAFNLFPPDSSQAEWNKDYAAMQENYIYKDTPYMTQLMESINTISAQFRETNFKD